jgi:hypothetical protein
VVGSTPTGAYIAIIDRREIIANRPTGRRWPKVEDSGGNDGSSIDLLRMPACGDKGTMADSTAQSLKQ